MIPLFKPRTRFRFFALLLGAAVVLLALNSGNAAGQRKGAARAAEEEESPLFHEYRGVQLGMTTDEVRKKLGSPKEKGDEQDFFIFDEIETAQIVYDKTHKVVTISADFLKPSTAVITATQVFGAELEANADGSIYKMVRYPKAGYWLSYNRTGGTAPLTSVTLQKIQ